MVFEAKFNPQDPLNVKLSLKFQGVEFSIGRHINYAQHIWEIIFFKKSNFNCALLAKVSGELYNGAIFLNNHFCHCMYTSAYRHPTNTMNFSIFRLKFTFCEKTQCNDNLKRNCNAFALLVGRLRVSKPLHISNSMGLLNL